MPKDSTVLKLAQELIDIPSTSDKEGEKGVADYISDYLRSCGIESRTFEYRKGSANLVAEIGGKDRLMLNGHMDTVPVGDKKLWEHGLKAELLNGELYGRGASDMKGGIASILAAVSDIDFSKAANHGILLTFVADEEGKFTGSNWLLDNKKDIFNRVKYGIIAEPTDMRIQVAQKGIACMKISFHGKAAHSSAPQLGDSAILKAARFITALEELAKGFTVEDKILGRGTVNTGKIKGGTATNVVPDSCIINVDRRIVIGETPELAADQVKGLLRKMGINAEVKLYGASAFKLDKDSKIIEIMKRASGSKTYGAPWYTEAEIYKRKANIDCAVFGPGYSEAAHQANERVSVNNLEQCTEVFKRVITEWCSS